MIELKINEEFKNLIPPLTPEEREGLKKSLLMFGCRDKIITWQGFVIDGHNRYEICSENNIDYQVLNMDYDFEDEEEVKQWIIKNQFSRRNISLYQRSALALKLKESISKKAKENQLSTLKQNTVSEKITNEEKLLSHECDEILKKDAEQPSENSFNGKTVLSTLSKRSEEETKVIEEPINTREEIAKIAGVSEGTIHKVETIENEAPEVIKDAAKDNQISVNKAYKITKEVKDLREEEKEDKATELLNQQYDAKAKEIDRQKKIADKIADAIFGILTVTIDAERLGYYLEYSPKEPLDKHIDRCDEAIEKLQEVKSIFQNMKKIKVVK